MLRPQCFLSRCNLANRLPGRRRCLRYFSLQWGRWMSPGWSKSPTTVPYASLGNPQSLNLYGYVGNDPISGQDPDGHFTYIWDDVTGGDSFGDNGDGMRKKEDAENRNRDQTKPGSGDQSQDQQQSTNSTTTVTLNSRPGDIPGGQLLHDR